MTELSPHTLLQSVVKLAEESDLHSLDRSLGKTVYQLLSSEHIAIGKIHNHPEIKEQKIVKYVFSCFSASDSEMEEDIEDELIKKDSDLMKCLTTQHMVIGKTSQDNQIRVIHPIHGNPGITGFLIIDCLKNITKDQELISMLLSFYENYVSLLTDNQHDKLTGLLNRKTFDEKITKIIFSQSS